MTNSRITLQRYIDAFIQRHGMTRTGFGRAALGDRSFVFAFARGRSPRLDTADRLMSYMGLEPIGPVFRREVEAFLAVTGFKASEFGQEVNGNPTFMTWLRQGGSPLLSTVDKTRAWMKRAASAEETRAIRAIASGDGPAAHDSFMGEHNMANDTQEYMTTRDVAAFLGLSPRTLDRYRVSGAGPGFHKFGNRVRYLRADVVAWAAERRCRSTSDAGAAKDTGLSGAASL